MAYTGRELIYPDPYKVERLSFGGEHSYSRWECKTGENSTIYLLSKLCVNGSNTENVECVQNYNDVTYVVLRKLVGLWSIFVGSLGISGNLLTLLAIPYAAKRKRYVFHFVLL